MAQKLSYSFVNNGWKLTMILNVELQQITNDNINVNYEIIGIKSGKGIINLKLGILYPQHEVLIYPYPETNTGAVKINYTFKVAKFTLQQIKTYLN